MSTITDDELVSLPAQRPQALVMFKDRHLDYGSTTLMDKLCHQHERRWMARTWIAMARRQESLIAVTKKV
jgi:hypothetical protein